jgi:hypothetical protein
MSDLSTVSVPRGRRPGIHDRRQIKIGNDTAWPRTEFAAVLNVCDRNIARMNLPTLYVGNCAFVMYDASMRIIADERVKRRGEPRRKNKARASARLGF